MAGKYNFNNRTFKPKGAAPGSSSCYHCGARQLQDQVKERFWGTLRVVLILEWMIAAFRSKGFEGSVIGRRWASRQG